MAAFVEVRNVSPRGDLLVVLDGDTREVKAGATLRVPPELAGRPPAWRPARTDKTGQPAEDLTGLATREHDGQLEVYDLGDGLLAQPRNWQPATPADTPKEK